MFYGRLPEISELFYYSRVVKAVKAAIDSSGSRSDAVAKLKLVFGVGQHDEPLVNYWMSVFCS